jgi:hypothetical protein
MAMLSIGRCLLGALALTLQAALLPAFGDQLTLPLGADLQLGGRINSHSASGLTSTWTGQFLGRGGHCMRVELSAQGSNLAMTVVGPDGSVYRNRDKGGTEGCTTCPLVVVPTTTTAAYTVILGHQAGIYHDLDFLMAAWLYPFGHAKCSPRTPKK